MGVFVQGWSPTVVWPRVTPTLVTAATLAPVTIAEAKAHARIVIADEDVQVDRWIRAATRRVEVDTGTALLTQTWDYTYDAFTAATVFDIPIAPVQSVTSIKYIDTDGDVQTVAGADYDVSGTRVGLADESTWPTDARGFAAVTMRVVAGYTSADLIPDDLVQAVLMMIAWMSETRAFGSATFDQAQYDFWTGPYRRVLVA